MRIKILKKCSGLKGIYRSGNVYDLPDEYAKEYIRQGFAIKVDEGAEQRKTKVIEPEKIKKPVFPEDRMDYTVRKKKRGRPKKQKP